MTIKVKTSGVLEEGTLPFTIESRFIREMGERLVKQPEVALLELVKNAFDADAEVCEIVYDPNEQIIIRDNGHGMTLDEFRTGWMRIGTSSKALVRYSRKLYRVITGEKGIGRFVVRFLGKALRLESVADDNIRGMRTLLIADFDWPTFDHNEDLGKVNIPYRLVPAGNRTTGTHLIITRLRDNASSIDLQSVRTSSIGVVTPYQSLLKRDVAHGAAHLSAARPVAQDPGFTLKIQPSGNGSEEGDVARAVLDNFVLRAVVDLKDDRLNLAVYQQEVKSPKLKIRDRYPNLIGDVYADIRFFPQRKGTFVNLPVDGRKAKTWVKDHSGVAVFDRTFRVHPYGTPGDDWLLLSADTSKRARDPRSPIAKKHFPMDEPTRTSTQLNYMLRLPYSQQLVGIVQVEGRRSQDQNEEDGGLIAAADREGFVDNLAFRQLRDVIRGAIEAIAAADRELQLEQEHAEQEQLLETLHAETQAAIREIQANPNIARNEKARIVHRLTQTHIIAETYKEQIRQREEILEIMSLLGVVAGFMTHEFGTALAEIKSAQGTIQKLAKRDNSLKNIADSLEAHITTLTEFVTYSHGYIAGASALPLQTYSVRPRIRQVVRVFGKYAKERHIDIEINVDGDLLAPLVPVSLYNGICLNLYTNALKAITAKATPGDRSIAFRAWNEQRWHYLEVSDTGVGIPSALRTRIFDPLFSTTATNKDPLGSGMGLGLTLVKRSAETFGGRVEVVEPPPSFTTCVRVQLPLSEVT